jgi:hypothetical protein
MAPVGYDCVVTSTSGMQTERPSWTSIILRPILSAEKGIQPVTRGASKKRKAAILPSSAVCRTAGRRERAHIDYHPANGKHSADPDYASETMLLLLPFGNGKEERRVLALGRRTNRPP